MKKRERIRAEIEKLSERRKQIDARIKTLEQQYKEEEMMEIQTIIRKAKLTPEEVEDLFHNKPVIRKPGDEKKQNKTDDKPRSFPEFFDHCRDAGRGGTGIRDPVSFKR